MLQLVGGDAWGAPGLHAVMRASLREGWGCIFLQKKHYNLLLCFFLLKSIFIIVCLSLIGLLLSIIHNVIDRPLSWDVDPNRRYSLHLIC